MKSQSYLVCSRVLRRGMTKKFHAKAGRLDLLDEVFRYAELPNEFMEQ